MIALDVKILDHPDRGTAAKAPWPDMAGTAIVGLRPDRAAILERGTTQGKATVILVAKNGETTTTMELTVAQLETLCAFARGAQQRWDNGGIEHNAEHHPV
jgi:hypothetical protein